MGTQGDSSSRSLQYGGYSFGFVGEQPSKRRYTQYVFVVDSGGVYHLRTPMCPGVNLELGVALQRPSGVV